MKDYLIEALRRPVVRSSGLISNRISEELREATARDAALAKIGKMLEFEVSGDDVMMAGADICNNVIDSYESRFAESSLRTIGKKIVGSAFACGHDMGGWGYATTFDARVDAPADGSRTVPVNARGLRELRDVAAATWVRGAYYWPAKASWAPDLAMRILFKITREVSAHWAFDLAVCSVCNDDLRKCDHFPGDDYEGKKCWYEMREVTDYIETSFVIKGGQYGTSTYPLGGEGRSVLPFATAIRELKSSKRLMDEWRKEIADVVATSREAGRRSRIGPPNDAARDWFAQAIAGKKPAVPQLN